ncbi:hypothetical protein [Pseudomonas quasicaspiana]|uniref:hypothetical protein n=1 Tax=Pseudomonas quasicaspiana TaxID=2829821 RepID=UPI001E55DE4E|nr:hypothetical protein [Pseudomonas quasicaspiana]MCD5971710.1 hypothetical protein [Pseudomonas quasicaspiana]
MPLLYSDEIMLLTCIAMASFIGLTILLMRTLTDAIDKNAIAFWTLAGIVIATLKIFLIQLTPQWSDLPLDSITYQLHAQALYMHWIGLPVDPYEYRLNGYISLAKPGFTEYWLPNEGLSYTAVLGTHAWFYSALVAIWQFITDDWIVTAILVNATMAGALPAATYIITRELSAPTKTCHVAAILMAIDPLTAINSSWLIKDTLSTFLSAIIIISICALYKRASFKFIVILAISLGLIGCVRFVAYTAFGVTIFGLVACLVFKKNNARALGLSISAIMAVFIWGAIYFAPYAKATPYVIRSSIEQESVRPLAHGVGQLGSALSGAITGQISTLNANTDESGADESVIKWYAYINEEPVAKIVSRSLARTLLAPYPWTLFTQPLTRSNHIELYLFGMLFWTLVLPGVLAGTVIILRKGVLAYSLVTLLIIIAIAYIIFFGEWSTRQRVFMMPLFLALSAIGWTQIWLFISKKKTEQPY